MSEIFFIGFAIFALLAQVLVIGLVVWGIIAWRQRAGRTADDPGGGERMRVGARRLYFYVVSFAALMMWVNGAALVGQFILDAVFVGDVAISSDTGLAAGASILVVGLPLWAFHWRYVQRAAGSAAAERGSLIRKFYLYAALAASAAVASITAALLLRWALGAEDFSGYHIAGLLAWAPVWVYHRRVEERERQGQEQGAAEDARQGQDAPDALALRRLYVYAAALAGLAALAIGAGRVVYLVFLEGYNALAGDAILAGDAGLWSTEMRGMLCVALVGGGVWALHWLWMARGDYGSELRQVYLYLFAIFGGAATALSALGVILRQTLVWIFGAASGVADPGDFDFLPGAIAALGVGAALWAYHRDRARREAILHYGAASGQARSSQRVYDYILAGIGTAALAVAIFTLVSALLKLAAAAMAGMVIVGGDLWRDPIATAIALTALGAPIWGYYWRKIQRRALAAGGDERLSVARRIYIFAALGAGALSLLGSVSALLFVLLRDALELAYSASTLADVASPLGVIAAAAAFLPYYWAAYARDRADAADDAADDAVVDAPADAIDDAPDDVADDVPGAMPRKDVALLAGGGDAEGLARELEAALGYSIDMLRWADADADTPALSDEALASVARRVADAAGERVLLLPDGDGLRVASYDD